MQSCQGAWEIQQVITSILQTDLPEEWFSDRKPHLQRLWNPVAPLCNFSYKSLFLIPKNFISSVRIALVIFPLIVCSFHENIPSRVHISWAVKNMTFHFAVLLWYIEYIPGHAHNWIYLSPEDCRHKRACTVTFYSHYISKNNNFSSI